MRWSMASGGEKIWVCRDSGSRDSERTTFVGGTGGYDSAESTMGIKFISMDNDEVLLDLLKGKIQTCTADSLSYKDGDLICLREPWALISLDAGYEYIGPVPDSVDRNNFEVTYRAGVSDFEESLISSWRHPDDAPDWASRITLEVIAVGDGCIAVRRSTK